MVLFNIAIMAGIFVKGCGNWEVVNSFGFLCSDYNVVAAYWFWCGDAPAYGDVDGGIGGPRHRLDVRRVEVGQRELEEAHVHSAFRHRHFVDELRDEARRKRDDEGL
jgi:hypothetical protein